MLRQTWPVVTDSIQECFESLVAHGNENDEIPGCPSAPLKPSERAAMFLKRTKHPKVFEIEFAPNTGEEEIILDDLTLVCGLEADTYSDEICLEFPPLSKDEGCLSWSPLYITPKPDETLHPESEEETPNPEEETEEKEPREPSDKDNIVDDIDTLGEGNDNGSGSTMITASLLVTLITIFRTFDLI